MECPVVSTSRKQWFLKTTRSSPPSLSRHNLYRHHPYHHHQTVRTRTNKHLTSTTTVILLLLLLFTCRASGMQAVSATTSTSLCSYTVVVDEFDLSKCAAVSDTATEPAQADSNVMTYGPDDATSRRDPSSVQHASRLDAILEQVGGKERERHARRAKELLTKVNGVHLPLETAGGGGPDPKFTSQVTDIETKLLDEMVRSRQFNSTLSRHEGLLSTAQHTLDAYRTNFSSLFRLMTLIERKLKHQRRVNRSLNKKLSNVFLDIVELNNVITNKLPTGDAHSARKQFMVESGTGFRPCPGFTDKTKQYKDCAEVYRAGHHTSDVYYIKPLYSACPVPVWCDMDSPGAGWLVFQRRRDGSVDFNRKWADYRDGFGELGGEHWLGNDNLFLLTNQRRYQLRIDLWDFDGNRVFAIYNNFKIDGERDAYRLHATGYSGSAKDSLARHSGKNFSTQDQDHDDRLEASCANDWEAGWWFDNCWTALLNGPYHNRSDVSWRGMAWNHWKKEQLRASEMKFKPVS